MSGVVRGELAESSVPGWRVKNKNLFKGYRLIACDGSDINIAHNPDDKESYFTNGNARGLNQLHLNAIYDLLDKIYRISLYNRVRLKIDTKLFAIW